MQCISMLFRKVIDFYWHAQIELEIIPKKSIFSRRLYILSCSFRGTIVVLAFVLRKRGASFFLRESWKNVGEKQKNVGVFWKKVQRFWGNLQRTFLVVGTFFLDAW